jgi:hypothetical protein
VSGGRIGTTQRALQGFILLGNVADGRSLRRGY